MIAAIRGYLDGVPTDEATTSLLHGVLGAVSCDREELIMHRTLPPAPVVARGVDPHPKWEEIVTAADLRRPTEPLPKPDLSALSPEIRARMEAESVALHRVPLATHEGADK